MAERTAAFLVEDFINAIASQLDRVQDALRVKAVNRPLNYALRDFSLDLQVFVDMDNQGNVRFRSAGPNESGASTIRLAFTTITRPMIEENTISLAMTRSPTLSELGLDQQEQHKLEHLGVRNAAQLQQLEQTTGSKTMARLTDIPLDRIRHALAFGRPDVHRIQPDQPHVVAGGAPPAVAPVQPVHMPGHAPAPHMQDDLRPPHGLPVVRESERHNGSGLVERPPMLRIAPDVTRLRLSGRNLIGPAGPPAARLNGLPLALALADEDELVFDLPDDRQSGSLDVSLPGGETLSYRLSFDQESDPRQIDVRPDDPWAPRARTRRL
jgi:hypothetical protein